MNPEEMLNPKRHWKVWLRESKFTVFLLAWSLFATVLCIKLYYDTESCLSSQTSDVKSTTMSSLLRNGGNSHDVKTTGLLGYEYENGKKCPYKWHGGAPDDSIFRGSCWCGVDSYCMCTPSLAIDAIIEVPASKYTHPSAKPNPSNIPYIVLVRRRDPPRDVHAIPGGFVNVGESAETATKREVKEETNLDIASLEQFKLYSEPTRDKRRHTVSAVFRCIVHQVSSHLHKGDDAKGIDVVRLDEIKDLDLAFDHKRVLRDFIADFHSGLNIVL